MEQKLIHIQDDSFEIIFDINLLKVARYEGKPEPALYLLFKGDLESTKITGYLAMTTWRIIYERTENARI